MTRKPADDPALALMPSDDEDISLVKEVITASQKVAYSMASLIIRSLDASTEKMKKKKKKISI